MNSNLILIIFISFLYYFILFFIFHFYFLFDFFCFQFFHSPLCLGCRGGPPGDSAVGKSSLVLRFVKGQFHEYQESTIGGLFFFIRFFIFHLGSWPRLSVWLQLLFWHKLWCWMTPRWNLRSGTPLGKKIRLPSLHYSDFPNGCLIISLILSPFCCRFCSGQYGTTRLLLCIIVEPRRRSSPSTSQWL